MVAALPNTDVLISIKNLRRSFREGDQVHKVLNGVSIDIAQGDTIALRGRSGSGKSTLLNLISGIDAPDEGEVFVSGHSISAMSERDRTLFRRENICFVYQAFNLVPTLTVADNIRLVLELNDVREPEAGDRIAWLLDAVGLADRANGYPDVLSGGEQQRVAIARAIAHSPKILLADEPTGNLDPGNKQRVLDILFEQARASAATLVVVTHDRDHLHRFDRVVDVKEFHDERGQS